jgi:hypothetical protein
MITYVQPYVRSPYSVVTGGGCPHYRQPVLTRHGPRQGANRVGTAGLVHVRPALAAGLGYGNEGMVLWTLVLVVNQRTALC